MYSDQIREHRDLSFPYLCLSITYILEKNVRCISFIIEMDQRLDPLSTLECTFNSVINSIFRGTFCYQLPQINVCKKELTTGNKSECLTFCAGIVNQYDLLKKLWR